MAATADHVELSSTRLVMGLQIGWINETDNPIPIKTIKMRLYLRGTKNEPLRFYPLERFARVVGEQSLQKTPVFAFTLPPKEIHAEQIRFLSPGVLDIPAGNYTVEIQITDTSNTSYTNRTTLQVESKIKYRQSEEWLESGHLR